MVIAPRKLARLESQDYMFVVGEWGCRIHDPMDHGSLITPTLTVTLQTRIQVKPFTMQHKPRCK